MHSVVRKAESSRSIVYGSTRKAFLLLVVMICIFDGAPGRAQRTTAAVEGTVADPSGAMISGATILVTNTGTGIKYPATADAQGSYHVTQLPPGSYTMEVKAKGFATEDLQAFTLFVDQSFQENITLAIGEETQSVSVSSAALLLDSQNSNEGQLIEKQQIDSMPLNGRDVLQLAQLSAGVTPIISGMNSPASQWTGPATVAISVAGLREDDVSYLYDGIETRNAWYGADGLLPSPDVVQEFKVEQSGAPAEYGDGGAFVNVVTRSGTNQFHGTSYEYVRNNDLDARNYFDVGPAPPFHQNQFGASLGGPIKKNKMFFFANYEGFRQIQPTDVYTNVPTSDQRMGNFGADTQQLVNPLNGYQPISGNQITSQYFDTIGQKILALYPLPNGSYVGGDNYFYVSRQNDNWDQESARFDDSVSSKDSVFVRFTNQNQTTSVTGLTSASEVIYPSNPKNVAVGWTRMISPNLVNNFRYGWSHTAVGEQRAEGYDSTDYNPLDLQNESDQAGSFGPPSFNVSNYGNPGSTEGSNLLRESLNMWTDSLMWQKGKHQLQFGADVRYYQIYMYEDWAATSLTFNGAYSKDPIADILLGIPSSTLTAIGNPLLNLRMSDQSYYAQDSWQLNHRLTVNFGLRWDHTKQPIDTANRVSSFDLATNQSLTYPDTKQLGLGRAMVFPQYLDFAPRVGLNWTPFANGNTVVKSGFGMYYLHANINQYEVLSDSPSLYNIQSNNNSVVGQPVNFTLGQLFTPTGGQSASFLDPHAKIPYTYEWNLAIDHTLKRWLLEVSTLGSAAHHYEEHANIDPINPDGTFPRAPWTDIMENFGSGSSFYEGLIARVEHQYSSGFYVLGSYTFSKCLGWPWQDVFSWHPLNLRLDRGHCQEDLTHNLVANTIYELPFGHNKPFLNKGALTNAIVGGWKIAAIASLHSGPWLTLGSNQTLGQFVNPLPDVSGPVNNHALNGGLGKNGRLGPYFNTQNVHAVTAVGVQGNSSVQSIYGPGSAEWDLSGDKTWTLASRYALTFRADVFNAFNRVNFNGLSTNVNDSAFGDVTGANLAREIQLSMRFAF